MLDPLCLIPARGISTGLPKKNFKTINGTPLVAHTINSALEARRIDDVIVSTESEELAEISKSYGAEAPFLRPPELSEADVLLNEVIDHAITELIEEGYEISDERPLVILQPNVPFTRPEDIDAAIRKYEDNGRHAIISVVEERAFFWRTSNDHLEPFHEERELRSELEPLYRETGSIYVTNRSILAAGDRVGDTPSYIVTDRRSAFEVDTLVDFWLAEKIKAGPEIVFRVDGGNEIGMGHIYRCITLARELLNMLEGRVTFVTDNKYEGGVEKLKSTEFDVVTVESGDGFEYINNIEPDIIFIDVLDTASKYVRQLRDTSAAVINLEDLGEGAEHADYVINALYEDGNDRHNELFGAEFVVVEQEFKDHWSNINYEVENVLLTFGGSDPSNISTRVITELGSADLSYRYKLVLGPDFLHDEALSEVPDDILSQVDIVRNSNDMPGLMKWADVAICSGGRTAYELAATGTPTLVVAHNEREAQRMQDLDAFGAVVFLGKAEKLEDIMVAEELSSLDAEYSRRVTMSENAKKFVDGSGVQRIMDLVYEMIIG
jgi:spore coat polysaccharide biosynthesis predicted glycosyltransferase SpsG/CMP-N-acetylneuraminic acid synthetase